ncbi:MAG: small multi-drug export protein [Epulopiscium sp.]|nr:small multi-drug export protein [Candidatus Epulonipiscium sp.]
MENISAEWVVFLVSAIPVLEQKAAIPIGLAENLNYGTVFIYSLLGSLLPSPFIILLIRKIFDWLRRFSFFEKIIEKLEKRALKKGEKVEKYALFGLFILVALPLPGTGVWTGSLVAALMKLEFKSALFVIALGAAVCGAILLFSGHGILSIIG